MAVAIGNTDFGADFARGAMVGNMRAQQAERMMQLKSQEALRQMQERQIAQEMEVRSQLFLKKQAQDQQDEADTRAFASLLKENVDQATASAQMNAQETGAEVDPAKIQNDVLQLLLPQLASKNPRAAAGVAKVVQPILADQSREDVSQARAAGKAAFEPFVQELSAPDGRKLTVLHKSPNEIQMLPNATNGKQVADEIVDKNGNVVSYVAQGANGPRFFPAKVATPSVVTKEKIKSIYGQVNRLQEQFDGMKDTTLFGSPNTKKLELGKRIDALKGEADKLDGGGVAKGAAPASVRVKVRDKAGKVFTVPQEQLDEAVAQGYEPVQE